jgi:hypothetical protein
VSVATQFANDFLNNLKCCSPCCKHVLILSPSFVGMNGDILRPVRICYILIFLHIALCTVFDEVCSNLQGPDGPDLFMFQ